jgi:hypothetical protein
VEEGIGFGALDAALGQGEDHLGDGDEEPAFVVEIGEFQWLALARAAHLRAFVRGVLEAEGGAADCRRFAVIARVEDVGAFNKHENSREQRLESRYQRTEIRDQTSDEISLRHKCALLGEIGCKMRKRIFAVE